MTSAEELLGELEPVTGEVQICLAGDLAGQIDALEAQLVAQAAEDARHNRDPEAPKIVERLVELQQRAAEKSVTFHLRAVGAREWRKIKERNPPSKKQQEAGYDHDPDKFQPAIVAASVTDPELTFDQASELYDRLSAGQWNKLVQRIRDVNTGADDAPKSGIATAVTRAIASGSITPPPTASP